MVLNYSCDQLRRVAASRFMSLMIDNAKVRRNDEVGKYFEQMFQKTFNLVCVNLLIHNVLHIASSLLSPSYRHIIANAHFILSLLHSFIFHLRASSWCPRSVILLGTVRHLAGQGASRRDAGSVSLQGRMSFSEPFLGYKARVYIIMCDAVAH